MLRITLPTLIIAAAFLSGCAQTETTETTAEVDFVSLFNGEDLTGWRGYNDGPMEGVWVAENGTLHLVAQPKGSPHANIITEGVYDDFDFRFEWKVEAGTNSGVMFNIGEGPKQPYLTGPEYQVLDDKGFRSGKGLPVGPSEYSGSHYAIEPPLTDATNPIGEWNAGRIVVRGNHVEYWINDQMTATYEMHSAKWKEQIANAKFAKWPDFATLDKGHIGLQDHGHRVWFRHLRIKEL
ncbi:DUF1080 domain-containing protein [Opitutaceae bacterium]|nr:DUF1080 domain-containing protein [Opitutaceae bacterium]